MLDATCRQLVAVLGATASSILRVEDDVLKEIATYWPWPFEPTAYEWPLGEHPLTREVLTADEPRVVSVGAEGADPAEVEALEALRMQALLLLTLSIAGQAWGVVEVY